MSYRIRIKPDWIKVDTFQAKRDEGRGAWAQPRHSAVRVTHQGYGIFAEASEGRSQFSNRAIAMERLELAIKDFLWPDGFHAPVNQAMQYINYTSIDTKARAHRIAKWYNDRRMEQLRGMHDGTIGFTVDPAVFAYDVDEPGPFEPVPTLKLPSIDWQMDFPSGLHQEFHGCTNRLQLERAHRFAEWEKMHGPAKQHPALPPEYKFDANRQYGKIGGSQQTLAYMQMQGRAFRTATVTDYQTALNMANDTFIRHQVASNIVKVGDEWQVSPLLVFRDMTGNVGDIYAAD